MKLSTILLIIYTFYFVTFVVCNGESVVIPPRVYYEGNAIPSHGHGHYQKVLRDQAKSILAYAAGWSNCDPTYFEDIFDEESLLTYPSLPAFQTSPFLVGLESILGDLALFCATPGNTNTSVYIPTYGMSLSHNRYWDDTFGELIYSYSANIQFRTTNVNGERESVNDVWFVVATYRMINGRRRLTILELGEWLDGRVKRLTALAAGGPGSVTGALQVLEDEPLLGAWPPAVPGKEGCLPGYVLSFCQSCPDKREIANDHGMYANKTIGVH